MNVPGLLLLGILLSSFVTGLVIFFLKEENHRLRTWLNLLGVGTKLILVGGVGVSSATPISLADATSRPSTNPLRCWTTAGIGLALMA